MYIPNHFRVDDPDELDAFMRGNPFATLVSLDPDGVPAATHLPMLLSARADGVRVLTGHVARANPQAKTIANGQSILTIFNGPHAYISPRWYQPGPSVPTWNYQAVHAYGAARLIEGGDALRAMMKGMVDHFEAGAEAPYRMEDMPGDFVEKQMRGIVAFEVTLTRVEGKYKLSQNRGADDAQGVIAALGAQPDQLANEVARAMLNGQLGGDR